MTAGRRSKTFPAFFLLFAVYTVYCTTYCDQATFRTRRQRGPLSSNPPICPRGRSLSLSLSPLPDHGVHVVVSLALLFRGAGKGCIHHHTPPPTKCWCCRGKWTNTLRCDSPRAAPFTYGWRGKGFIMEREGKGTYKAKVTGEKEKHRRSLACHVQPSAGKHFGHRLLSKKSYAV